MSKYYTVYDARTDDILAFGESMQCAKMLGITHASFYSMASRVRKGKCDKYALVIEFD